MRFRQPYFPNSSTEILLKAIARKLGGRIARDFAGIIVNKHRILYRHAQFGITKFKGKGYERLNWSYPFGREGQLDGLDFVLLHASKPEEKFFLFDEKKALILYTIFPENLNLTPNPQIDFSRAMYERFEIKDGRRRQWLQRSVGRKDVLDSEVPLAVLKRVLNK